MLELLVFGVLAFVFLLVVSVVGAAFSLVLLPFKLLGWMLKGVGLLLALPLMLLFAVLAAVIFGFGMIAFLIPALPVIAVVWLLWKALAPRSRPVST